MTFRGSRRRLIQFGAAAALVVGGVVAFGTAAFAHDNIITASATCASPVGSGYKIAWTVANDYNLSEHGGVTTITGGIATVTPYTISLAASGNGSGGNGTLPYQSTVLNQTLPASYSGIDTITIEATYSDNYTVTDSGSVTLPTCQSTTTTTTTTIPPPTTTTTTVPPTTTTTHPGTTTTTTTVPPTTTTTHPGTTTTTTTVPPTTTTTHPGTTTTTTTVPPTTTTTHPGTTTTTTTVPPTTTTTHPGTTTTTTTVPPTTTTTHPGTTTTTTPGSTTTTTTPGSTTTTTTPGSTTTTTTPGTPQGLGLTIVKTERVGDSGTYVRGPLVAAVGQKIEYRMVVTNESTVALSVLVTDPLCDVGTLLPAGRQNLAVGASLSYTCTHVLLAVPSTHQLTNTASVTGVTPSGEPVGPATSTVTLHVYPPVLSIGSLPGAKPDGGVGASASFTG